MILTPVQNRAINSISGWLSEGTSSYFVLAGYAGTGKTTILQEFINGFSQPVLCCAPTGKAAAVLGKRLKNVTVSTIHRALYKPVEASTTALDTLLGLLANNPEDPALAQAVAEEREYLANRGVGFSLRSGHDVRPCQLVVIDEASMVSKRMHLDLLKTGAKILYVGDPGQLPPVMDEGFFRWNPPDVMLTEVMRQALDSPIIRLSMEIRNGGCNTTGHMDEGPIKRMPKSDFPGLEWLKYDQILTGKNDSRQKVNKYFRNKLYPDNQSWYPIAGDKLICLKNDYGSGLVNGIFGRAVEPFKFHAEMQELLGQVLYEGEIVAGSFHRHPFAAHYDSSSKETPRYERDGLLEFDYGYAITVHKSQGSEWPRVILADDRMRADDREFRKLWLYTAITRAQEELVWLY